MHTFGGITLPLPLGCVRTKSMSPYSEMSICVLLIRSVVESLFSVTELVLGSRRVCGIKPNVILPAQQQSLDSDGPLGWKREPHRPMPV